MPSLRSLLRRSAVLLAVAACNAPPTAPVVAIAPIKARTDAELKASIVTAATDPQGDAVTYTFAWLKNNAPQNDLRGDTVAADKTAKGDVWTVIATPSDGKIAGPAGQASVTIENTPPVATVTFEPVEASANGGLKAVAAAQDADADTVTFTYAWTKNGQATSFVDDTIPAAQLVRGDAWKVTVTPKDTEAGEAVSLSTTIGNAKPVAPGVKLSPEQPTKATPLFAQAEAGTDADKDTVTLKYTWTVNGQIVEAQSGPALAPNFFNKGQTVTVIVTPNDGKDDGTPATASVTVANTAPTAPSVNFAARPKDADDVVCTIANPSLDIDADAVSYAFTWTKNEQPFNSATTSGTTSTVAAGATGERDVFKCSAIATDGTGSSPASNTAQATVNAKPVLASVALSPVAPTKATPIYANPAAPADADGDVVQLKYAWLVNGGSVIGQSAAALAPNFFAKGQSVSVIVTPNDGLEDGTPALAAVTAQNTPPTAPGITITASPRDADDVVCSVASASVDLDNDPITYLFSWTKNGQLFNSAVTSGTTSTVPASATANGDLFGCSVTATDGTATTAGNSVSTTVNDAFRSCAAIKALNPAATDGLYDIDPDGTGPLAAVKLFCDMTNGGWTLVANIYDSAGDDAPNTTDYVVSGWQQTASGAWNNVASKVEKNSSGTGSAAVSLAFVAALKAGASQQNLKMCFVHQNGTDTTCRSSADGSMTLVSYATGNPKLTVYSGNTLPYTYGRLAGLAGGVDSYNAASYTDGASCIPRHPGSVYEFGLTCGSACASIDGFCDKDAVTSTGFAGVWHAWGWGMAYRPWASDENEIGTGTRSGPQPIQGPIQPNPNMNTYGFRLYVGP